MKEKSGVTTVTLPTGKLFFREEYDHQEAHWRREALLVIKADYEILPKNESEWIRFEDLIQRVVSDITDWGMCAYGSGPGRAYAHTPCVYEPVEIYRRYFIKATWSGGVDI